MQRKHENSLIIVDMSTFYKCHSCLYIMKQRKMKETNENFCDYNDFAGTMKVPNEKHNKEMLIHFSLVNSDGVPCPL